MRLNRNANLVACNAFAVAARAKALATINHWYELDSVTALPEWQQLPVLVLGSGTNILFRDDFPGLVLHIANRGVDVIEESDDHVFVRVAAGENWHNLVCWSVQRGLWGIENLAMIPGTVGAAPVQNIGAYGVEVSDTLQSVKAFDRLRSRWVTLSNQDCQFGYRRSRFRDDEPERFLITEVVLRLARDGVPRNEYPGVVSELQKVSANDHGPADVAEAIMRLRSKKLPDPEEIGNAGSFFKNPVVTADRLESLLANEPEAPAVELKDGSFKLSAAWLIDQCGWKGHREGDAGVYLRHALVLVNYGTATGAEIWNLACQIQTSVVERYGIVLEPEPLVL
jgi:UDP-N-acetylmuramate dehydrogenase